MQNSQWLNEIENALDAPEHLYSIMNQVDIGLGKVNKKERLVARTLKLDDSFLHNENGQVKQELKADMERLKTFDLISDDYTAYHVAQKFGWRTPAKKDADKGISWFDELRIDEAIKACGETDKYLLVKGDLTGIQEFIDADINLNLVGGAKNIAKRLRGKSFFVSVMTDFLAELLLENLDLPVWNLLFAGGGHFNLLVPETDSIKAKILKWEEDTQLHLTQQLGGRLGLVIATTSCDKDVVDRADTYFEKLNNERDKQKYRKGFDYLQHLFYPVRASKPLPVKHFEEIGAAVPKSDFLLVVNHNGKVLQLENVDPVDVFTSSEGISLFLAEDAKQIAAFVERNAGNIDRIKILLLNKTDFLPETDVLKGKSSFGFKLVGKETPKNGKELKDFEEITEEYTKDGKLRYEMLAVMRLDVDDLGCIFSNGMKPASLKAVVALSREMSFFFSGYFNHLANKEKIYVVYSGGDDAFVIGHWHFLLRFANLLHQEFESFVNGNPNIHFSAGIFTCDAHYPVAKFADDAKYLLEADAKKHFNKNRLVVFNHRISWKHFSEMLEFGDKVIHYSAVGDQKKSEKIARSVINRVLTIVKNSFYEKTELDDEKQWVKRGHLKPENFYRNLANLKYLFARQCFDAKAMNTHGDLPGNIEGDVIKIILNAFEASQNNNSTKSVVANDLKVALNYALYTLREPNKNK